MILDQDKGRMLEQGINGASDSMCIVQRNSKDDFLDSSLALIILTRWLHMLHYFLKERIHEVQSKKSKEQDEKE